jgi:hypothetical protein
LNPARVKRILFASAMILAAIAFTTIFVPLSSHVYTVEEEKPYPTVTSWTEQWSSVSTSYTTEEHVKTKYTFIDNPNDSDDPSQDISSLALEKEENLLHVYLSMSHGGLDSYLVYLISFDFDGDSWPEYIIWLDSNGCELWKYPSGSESFMVSKLQYEAKDGRLHVIVPMEQIGNRSTFYMWASVSYWTRKQGKWLPSYPVDVIGYSKEYEPPNPVDFELTYSETYTLYRTSTYTSTLSSIYTTTSTETHTLTEKVSLSYWYAWLPYPFFAGAGAAAITLYLSEAIPYIKSKRKKAAPVIALPEGARLVKLCPSCGAENPLDAEYCHECGARF